MPNAPQPVEALILAINSAQAAQQAAWQAAITSILILCLIVAIFGATLWFMHRMDVIYRKLIDNLQKKSKGNGSK